jgi:hypothetical protein
MRVEPLSVDWCLIRRTSCLFCPSCRVGTWCLYFMHDTATRCHLGHIEKSSVDIEHAMPHLDFPPF